jgi:hypothetical protein
VVATVLQLVGAVLVLVPFTWQQVGSLRADSARYLWPNVLGSLLLSALALADEQWGFLLLEGVWALVAARGLVLLARQDPAV